jgi:hypothetical protein
MKNTEQDNCAVIILRTPEFDAVWMSDQVTEPLKKAYRNFLKNLTESQITGGMNAKKVSGEFLRFKLNHKARILATCRFIEGQTF